jgi:hypothetical protein
MGTFGMSQSSHSPADAGPDERIQQLIEDIESAAALADARFDRDVTCAAIAAYEPYFLDSAISFRTSTKPVGERELNVRYVELRRADDAYAIACRSGLLKPDGGAVHRAMAAIQDDFPILGYGVDIGVAFGLEKIWPFFPHRPRPVDAVCDLAYLPEAARRFLPYFKRHRLDSVSLFALDFRNQSANLYFMQQPGSYSAAEIAAMFRELGLAVPDDSIIELCCRSIPVYCTFSWDSPSVLRLCFGIPFKNASEIPSGIDPTIDKYVQGAPFATEQRSFILSVTCSERQCFVKVENDYSATMIALMEQPQ